MNAKHGLLVAVAAASFALSGCTGDTPEPSTTPTTSATASSTPSTSTSSTPSESPSATPSSDGVATDSAAPTPTATAGSGRVSAVVALTRYGVTNGELTAAGFVQDVVEEGGYCTITATRGDRSASASGLGTPSAASTDCGEGLSIDTAQLGSGDWKVVLSYRSDGYEGASAPVTVTVP
ncbi:hypothetical protein RN607_13445 [Demequina capsici]|uniref:Secreted protein n=1 Tax=Demequina capsici TaxID=3075620 RepID=A0AA96F750_9MICO|nr:MULTISPECIES: hypothetical protein [unclassified Demequina]WNM24368.1 hypothetical protein RN606_13540 [Demequina sp. OYTSA14]WNM27190.1 hypothetical protein RN607_13445 [Demequina sp. PMTSA13]